MGEGEDEGDNNGAPAGTRTRAHGLGNRWSIQLAYRGLMTILATKPQARNTKIDGSTYPTL